MRLALLSNIEMGFLAGCLPGGAYIPPGHDTWRMEISAPASGFNTAGFDAAFIILHCKDAKRGWRDRASGEGALSEWLASAAAAVKSKPGTRFFIANLDIEVDAIRPADAPQPERGWEHYWQQGVFALAGEYPNVFLLDIKSLVEEHGRAAFYSPKMWYAGGSPYSLRGIKAIAGEIASLLGASGRKKVLVTDLDNTLWGGAAGEDGVSGVELSPHKEGARFYDLQLRLAEMAATGAVLAIASKNDPEDAHAVIDGHPHMALRRESFAAERIGWGGKSDGIREMAAELNLGLDSFVFLDDNPLEREAVRQELPEVTVAAFPADTAMLEKTAADIYKKYFRALTVTREDARKTAMYRQEAGRRAVRAASATPAEYIRSLEMEVSLRRMSTGGAERAAQLCGKTNQFNLTSKRYGRGELLALAEAPGCAVLTLHSRDKFGDSGMVGVIIMKEQAGSAAIDTFLLSCRAMGRAIEDHAAAAVAGHYKGRGFARIEAAYVPTAKNSAVSGFYSRLGFAASPRGDGGTDYIFSLESPFPVPEKMYKSFTAEF